MTEKKRRLSQLQKVVLAVLLIFPNKAARISDFSLKVALSYCPEKLLRLEELTSEKVKHRKALRLPDKFSVSLSRSMRTLESKGMVELIRGEPMLTEEQGNSYSVIKSVMNPHSTKGRATVIIHYTSPFFKSTDSGK
jgi:hypothetical protein